MLQRLWIQWFWGCDQSQGLIFCRLSVNLTFFTIPSSLYYRISTFEKPYPYPHQTKKLNPTEFAKAGFIRGSPETDAHEQSEYNIIVEGPEDDSVFCPFCFKALSEFEEGDNPWKEHKSHKPDCVFIQMTKNSRARQSSWMNPLATKRGGQNKELAWFF